GGQHVEDGGAATGIEDDRRGRSGNDVGQTEGGRAGAAGDEDRVGDGRVEQVHRDVAAAGKEGEVGDVGKGEQHRAAAADGAVGNGVGLVGRVEPILDVEVVGASAPIERQRSEEVIEAQRGVVVIIITIGAGVKRVVAGVGID